MGLFNKLFKKQPDEKDANAEQKADIKAAASRNEKKGKKGKQEKEPGSCAGCLPSGKPS